MTDPAHLRPRSRDMLIAVVLTLVALGRAGGAIATLDRASGYVLGR